jgi:hypothetical protein
VSTLRYDAADGRVITATGGGVIVVWSDSTKVGMTEGIVLGPYAVDEPRERPRSVDQLADWYQRQLRELGGTTYEELLGAVKKAEEETLAAADRYAQAKLRLREFEATQRASLGGAER